MQRHDTVTEEMDNGRGLSGEEKFETLRILRVLFVCAGDSSRVLMAESWANHLGDGWIEALSATTGPQENNPRALAVMREAGLEPVDRRPARLTPEMLAWANLVVTIRGHADDPCPALPSWIRKNHWPLNNPAGATGAEEEIMREFRVTRDIIRTCVTSLIAGRRAREAARR
jgi:arsenate reductase